MADYQYLNEERYQKNKKTLIVIAVAILILGLLIGGGLITGGIIKKNNAAQIDDSMPTYSLESSFADVTAGSSRWINAVSQKSDEDFAASVMIGIGIFITIASVMGSASIITFAKRREIMAFKLQQVAPVAKEGIEKAAPVIGNATGEMAKAAGPGVGEAIGGITKEVAKGVNKGLKED